jgi:signal peptidase I
MRRLLRVASLCAVVAAIGACWYFLAPTELGGSTSYAVVYGSSMEPRLHRGDLVVLRGQPGYRVGEVVGYHSSELHRNVLHRIVGRHDSRFVFKGDNNDFLDPEQPRGGQLFGSEWVVVPRLGGVLEHLRSPRDAAIAAGLAVLLVVGTGAGPGVRRRRRSSSWEPVRMSAAPIATAPPPPPRAGSRVRPLLLALGVAGLAATALGAVVGVLALQQPEHRTVAEPGLVVQRGAFSWSAPAPVGAVYQRGSLRLTDPVFLRLVHTLTVRFTYGVRSRYAAAFSGTAALDAVLSDGSGWRRRVVVARRRDFHGTRLTLAGRLDLTALTTAIRRFEATTGEHNPAYHLELVPRVSARGIAGGRPVRAAFAPSLAFDLDELRLQLAHPPGGVASNALVRTKAIGGSRTTTATLDLFGRSVTVSGARRLAVTLTGAGIVLALAAAAFLLLRRRDDELAAIERRFGDLIVPVAAGAHRRSSERAVATIDDLARIAERYDRLILHETRPGGHSFLVDDAGVVYRFDVGAPPEETTEIRLDDAPRPRPSHLQAADR